MIDIASIFKNRVLNVKHLLEHGFAKSDGGYCGKFDLPDQDFYLIVLITYIGEITAKVFDKENDEEYVLVNIHNAEGRFVGAIINSCEEILKSIAQKCFDYQVFKSSEAKQIAQYVKNKYGDSLEFLWKKSPNNAILRRKDTKKWYAAILTVEKRKLKIEDEGTVEVIDLRAQPREVECLVDNKKYFSGYHMNKKHWYTICLNGTVNIEDIKIRIDESYLLAK